MAPPFIVRDRIDRQTAFSSFVWRLCAITPQQPQARKRWKKTAAGSSQGRRHREVASQSGAVTSDAQRGWVTGVFFGSCILSLLILLLATSARAGIITSAGNGTWSNGATWVGGVVPAPGDQVVVAANHAVTIAADTDIGHSPDIGIPLATNLTRPADAPMPSSSTSAGAALCVKKGGSLTVGAGKKLTVRGNLDLNSTLKLEAGAKLVFDTSLAPTPSETQYWMKIWPVSPSFGRLVCRGTAETPCRVESNPANHASIISGYNLYVVSANNGYINYTVVGDGGQIDAEQTVFQGMGDGRFPAFSYRPGATGIYRLQDCLFNQCGRVLVNGSPGSITVPVTTSMERVRWTNSIPKAADFKTAGNWGILQTGAGNSAGTNCRLIACDVDANTLLFDLNGYTIEDCVFRGGVLGFMPSAANPAIPASFKRNLMRFLAGQNDRLTLPYGATMEDCLLIHDYDTADNPHFLGIRYNTGVATVRGCVFWYSSTLGVVTDGGDGAKLWDPSSGTRDTNSLLIEKCIFLPNGKGPDDHANLSCNIASGLMTTANATVTVRRNTSFGGQGVSCGETSTTYAGTIKAVKSNLFIGPADNSGMKMNDFGHGETNVIAAAGADYNAGYRMKNGSNYIAGQTGKGYDLLKLSGDLAIGHHDIDGVDPQLVDPARTPRTWSTSRGGNGTMSDAMDRLAPNGAATIQELLDYIREGMRPKNPVLKGAGDPADGAPDIGAVDQGSSAAYQSWADVFVWTYSESQPWVDFDGDGASNAAEFAAGTDPTDAASKPSIASGLINISGTEMLAISFRRRTTDQLVAVATSSTNLASWSGPAATPIPGTTLESQTPDGAGFEIATYRIHDSLANAAKVFLRAEFRFP